MSQTTPPNHAHILRTKLHRPLVPRDFVCRPRLHDAMDRGSEVSVVLFSAPAGYGKSMLVSHWIEARAEPCAWLSLDDTDSDVDVFLQYLLAAIETIYHDACPNTGLLTRAAELPPIPVVAKTLINELDAVTAPFFLVLDDYHHLAPSSAAHELLRQVLAPPPPSMHLILVSRRDPPLGLTALRAQGRLNEIRLAELRFTAAETRSLLESVMGLTASDATVANLQQQMECWAVGLRLVTLALRLEGRAHAGLSGAGRADARRTRSDPGRTPPAHPRCRPASRPSIRQAPAQSGHGTRHGPPAFR